MEGYFTFQWRRGGRAGVVFQMGEGIIFKWRVHGEVSVFMGWFQKKLLNGRGACPPPLWFLPTNQKGLLEEMEGVNYNFSAFMHLDIKIKK